MISFGTNIRSKEVMKNLTLQQLVNYLQTDTSLRQQCNQLKEILHLDAEKYRNQKCFLPYFLGAEFQGNLRNTQNFICIQYFMLDLDHLSQAGLEVTLLKQKLAMVPELMLGYVSPSGDGLKLLFKLGQKITNSKYFSDFYTLFARHFFQTHRLENVGDMKTKDVSRVSFAAYDPDLYFNPNAMTVNPEKILPMEMWQAPTLEVDEQPTDETTVVEVDADTMAKIRAKLNPNFKKPSKEKKYFVPEALEQAEIGLAKRLQHFGIKLGEVRPINYGKKFLFELGIKFAELNVFYGKNGFSVVISPKRGHDAELSQIVEQLMWEHLYQVPQHQTPNKPVMRVIRNEEAS
ncbi:CRISPR-associated primase-polymerase type B [Persicobacter psychrovividus]|uniref:BT4734-like N-terminal domain-containing protein n=1 Tax=Persicobacter psychrovividus TaxID=387638 RepID=A0ABM7VM33_9BACT|nr:hypothetical protein PEPS_43470 [Persicobacter psychrovividus]